MPTHIEFPDKALVILTHLRAGQQNLEKSLIDNGLGLPKPYLPMTHRFTTMGSYHAVVFRQGINKGILGLTIYMENLEFVCNCPRWKNYTPERWLDEFLGSIGVPVSYIYYHNPNITDVKAKIAEMRLIDYFRSQAICPLYVNPNIENEIVQYIPGWFKWQG